MATNTSIASVAAMVGAAEQVLVFQVGTDRELIAACNAPRHRRQPPHELAPRRRRQMAVYIAAVELEVASNSDIARALHISRQAVKQARDRIDDLREASTAVDALITRAAKLIAGG